MSVNKQFLSALMMVVCATGSTASAQNRGVESPASSPAVDQDSDHPQKRASVAFTEPYRVVELAASEMGRISQLKVRRGSRVKNGELLCELDVSTLEARRRTAEKISRSTARREALEIEQNRKQRRLKSLQSLVAQGGGTPEEVAEAEAEARIAGLNVRAAEEDLERAQLEVSEIDAQIEQRRIRAGFAGVITDVHREAGEFVSSADPKVATLVDLSRLRASFFLPTELAANIKENDKRLLRFLGTGQEVNSVVEYVGPLTNAASGRVRVDVIVKNDAERLRSGLQCVLPESSRSTVALRHTEGADSK